MKGVEAKIPTILVAIMEEHWETNVDKIILLEDVVVQHYPQNVPARVENNMMGIQQAREEPIEIVVQ